MPSDKKLNATVIGKRKREHGLVVLAKYIAMIMNKDFATILPNKLLEKKDKRSNFEFEIETKIVSLRSSTWYVQ